MNTSKAFTFKDFINLLTDQTKKSDSNKFPKRNPSNFSLVEQIEYALATIHVINKLIQKYSVITLIGVSYFIVFSSYGLALILTGCYVAVIGVSFWIDFITVVYYKKRALRNKYQDRDGRNFLAQRRAKIFGLDPFMRYDEFTQFSSLFYDEAIALTDIQTSRGIIKIKCPSRMLVTKRYMVQAFFNKADVLNNILSAKFSREKIKSSIKLEVKGEDFNIHALNEGEQDVQNFDANWAWQITPKVSGFNTLVFILSTAKESSIGWQTNHFKNIKVRAPIPLLFKEFCKTNWTTILGTLAGSGALFQVLKVLGYLKS